MDEEKTCENTGTVIAANKHNRTYTVKLDSGEFRKRNRKDLLPIVEKQYNIVQERGKRRKQDPFKNVHQEVRSNKGRLTLKPKYLKDYV